MLKLTLQIGKGFKFTVSAPLITAVTATTLLLKYWT